MMIYSVLNHHRKPLKIVECGLSKHFTTPFTLVKCRNVVSFLSCALESLTLHCQQIAGYSVKKYVSSMTFQHIPL